MSLDFILILVLGAWVGVNEWRLSRLEKEIKNFSKESASTRKDKK